MPSSLNVVALISGGKDSLFSLIHCIQNGHQVVAIANLYPPAQNITCAEANSRYPSDQAHDRDGLNTDVGIRQDAKEDKDLNSFMYQTVGYSLIPLYSEVLQLPLYRQQISGTSIQQSQYYDTSDGSGSHCDRRAVDETEDLIPLLRKVIDAHPEINAVSTGAILSTYQRTRIESIAVRLGLTPLSYLWQYPVLPAPVAMTMIPPQATPQRPDSLTGLLEDMASTGLDARIIKIASAGIPENVQFSNVADARTQKRLVDGLAPFFEDEDEFGLRGAVLGEGGEYETIALSGPREVWKGGKIDIDEGGTKHFTDGGVTYTSFGKAIVVPHDVVSTVEHPQDDAAHDLSLVPVPALLDPQFSKVKTDLDSRVLRPLQYGMHSVQRQRPTNLSSGAEVAATDTKADEQNQPSQLSITTLYNKITINNLNSTSIRKYLGKRFPPAKNLSSEPASSAAQLQTILSNLPVIFANLGTTLALPPTSTSNITSTTLLLRNMADFTTVNPIYSQVYPAGLPNPPARVTIAAPLPSGTEVSLSLVLDICAAEKRRGLHIQGRSYWAPANIGPYSQAICVPLRSNNHEQGMHINTAIGDEEEPIISPIELVHIAGQISLIPSSMEVHPGPFLDSAILSLQHLWRVGQERDVDIWPWAIAYLAQQEDTLTQNHVATVSAIWTQAHLEPTWSTHTQPGEDKSLSDNQSDQDSDGDLPPPDIWDLQRNRSLHTGFRRAAPTVGKHLHILPNHTVFASLNPPNKVNCIPPLLAAQVTALPRNVEVEWWSNGIARLCKPSTSSSHARPRLRWHSRTLLWGSISWLSITSNPFKPRGKVLFIAYLISKETPNDHKSESVDSTAIPEPSTLSNLMSLMTATDTDTDADLAPASVQLVQGLACIALTSQTNNLEPLISTVTTIPCHTVHGHGLLSYDKTQHDRYGDQMEELRVGMLLRVETS